MPVPKTDLGASWAKIIGGGFRLSNREIFRERFLTSIGRPILHDPLKFRRLQARENILGEIMADNEKSALFSPYRAGPQAPQDLENFPAIEKSNSSTFALYPFNLPPEKNKTKDEEISQAPLEYADWFLRATALGHNAALVGAAPLDERFLYTRTFDGRAIGPEGEPPEPMGSRPPLYLPAAAKSVLALAFLRDSKIMGMNGKLWTIKPEKWLTFDEQLLMVSDLAAYMRALGFEAFPALGGLFQNAWLGALAGLGEVGRQGLLISPEYGPNLRLFSILTDWPLIFDQPKTFGVADYCDTCQRCINDCPAKAIPAGRLSLSDNGLWEWPLDRKACLSHFLEKGELCRACIETCPYTREPLIR